MSSVSSYVHGGSDATDVSTDAGSQQSSQLTVTGTASSGEQLVFHFTGSLSATGANSVANANTGEAAVLSFYFGADQYFADAYRWGDGSGGLELHGAAETADGFDFTEPLNAAGVDHFTFEADVQIGERGQPDDATFGGSVNARLSGIEARDAQGNHVSSAIFDPSTGFATISADVVATPEPGTLVLLASGLVGIAPLARRRRR